MPLSKSRTMLSLTSRGVRQRQRRRRFRARRRKNFRLMSRPSTTVQRQLPGFPWQTNIKHKYADSFEFNPQTGLGAEYKISMNSLNDPDITSAGHAPSFYNNMGAIYQQYVVIFAKIKCVFSPALANLGTTPQEPFIAGITQSRSSGEITVSTLGSALRESPYTKSKTLFTSFNGGPRQDATLRSSNAPATVLGVSHPLSTTGIGAGFGNSPTLTPTFVIWVRPVNTTQDIPAINVDFEVEYTAVWTRPNQQPEN